MRFASSRSEADRADAWKAFEALEMLNLVTGMPGLLARSMCSPEEQDQNQEHPTVSALQ